MEIAICDRAIQVWVAGIASAWRSRVLGFHEDLKIGEVFRYGQLLLATLENVLLY
jgi:hypothetical protein